jgi:hypothetical protein
LYQLNAIRRSISGKQFNRHISQQNGLHSSSTNFNFTVFAA